MVYDSSKYFLFSNLEFRCGGCRHLDTRYSHHVFNLICKLQSVSSILGEWFGHGLVCLVVISSK